MRILVAIALTIVALSGAVAQDEQVPRSATSPDGRYTVRITNLPNGGDNNGDAKLELIEKVSGRVVSDLNTIFRGTLPKSVFLWSSDSQWFAYGTGSERDREATVYFRNADTFEPAKLPDEFPAADIKFRKGDDESVKNYGGGTKPLRWLKPGELQLQSEQTMMSRESGRTYTGTLTFTLSFDAQHQATIKNVSKTKTRVE